MKAKKILFSIPLAATAGVCLVASSCTSSNLELTIGDYFGETNAANFFQSETETHIDLYGSGGSGDYDFYINSPISSEAKAAISVVKSGKNAQLIIKSLFDAPLDNHQNGVEIICLDNKSLEMARKIINIKTIGEGYELVATKTQNLYDQTDQTLTSTSFNITIRHKDIDTIVDDVVEWTINNLSFIATDNSGVQHDVLYQTNGSTGSDNLNKYTLYSYNQNRNTINITGIHNSNFPRPDFIDGTGASLKVKCNINVKYKYVSYTFTDSIDIFNLPPAP